MGRTWGDIQAETLQYMFSYTLNDAPLIDHADTADYRNAMPQAANYALRDLASTAAPLVRKLSLSLAPVPNMLGDGTAAFNPVQSVGQEIVYSAIDPKAVYFEVDNPCTIYIEQDIGNPDVYPRLYTITNATKRSFQAYQHRISVMGAVRVRFLGGTAYNIRNVAFYAVDFPTETDIPPFTRYDKYDLRALTAGQPGYEFMELAPNSVVRVEPSYYVRHDDFRWEGNSVFVADHYLITQYDIYYHAYPATITADTSPDFVVDMMDEALDLVPLYIASRLYADDNPPLAASYLNRYMARRAELSNRDMPLGTGEFISESGWV